MDKNKIVQTVISKMLLIAPENYINLDTMQVFINLYHNADNKLQITYGIVQVSDDKQVVYIDNNTPATLSTNEQAKADISIELRKIAELGIDQIMVTLHKEQGEYQGRVSYYNDIFTSSRNDPEAELLFWRSQMGYIAENDEQQKRIDKVAEHFKD